MKAFRIIIVILALTAALFIISAWRTGLLVRPLITEQQFGPGYLIYREHSGPYQGIYQVLERLKTTGWHGENFISPAHTFGFPLNNPEQVRPDSLRWLAGIVLDQLPDQVDGSFKTAAIDRLPALVAEIRQKSKAAALIGPFVIYPQMEKFARENGYRKETFVLGEGIIELYRGEPGQSITYVMPVSKKSVNLPISGEP